MGSGKGEVSHHAAVVLPGKIIYEIAGVSRGVAVEALRKAGDKMPFKTKIVEKE
jgi:large subunit ribosomal protein L16